MRKTRIKEFLIPAAVIAAVVFVVYLPLILFVRYMPGDDLDLIEASTTHSLWERLVYCWNEYSGRVFAKSLEYLFTRFPIGLFKVCGVLAMGLSGLFYFRFYHLFTGRKRVSALVLCLLLPLLMDHRVFAETSLWVAGSANYLFIFLPGLIGAYLFVTRFTSLGHVRKDGNVLWFLLTALLLLLCATSSEQGGAILIAFLLVCLIHQLIRKEKAGWTVAMEILLIAGYVAVTMFCPGTKKRMELEIAAQLPDFRTVPFVLRMRYGIRFILDRIVNAGSMILHFIWAVLAALLILRKKKNVWDILLITGLVASFFAPLLALRFPWLLDFQAVWGIREFGWKNTLTVLLWCASLLFTLLSIFRVFDRLFDRILGALLFLAAIASIALMLFSPTMYASGYRTFFWSCVMFFFLLMLLHRSLFPRLLSTKPGTKAPWIVSLYEFAVAAAALSHAVRLILLYASSGFTQFP